MLRRVLIHFVTVSVLVLGRPDLGDEMEELANMIRENCVEEIGVDTTLLDKIDAGADLMPDAKLKCYIKCTMETAGMLSDGEVDVENVLGLLPEDIKTRNEGDLRKCDTQKGTDDCDTAYQTQVCWQNANKVDYIFI